MSAQYPEVAEALEADPCKDFVVDGEVVALDSHGITSFARLQRRGKERVAIYLYVFDLLRFEGTDLRELPLRERKPQLRDAPALQGPASLHPAPQRARRASCSRRPAARASRG